MGKWFAHSASGIDAQAEWAAVRSRNAVAWARLVARLTSAVIDPDSTADDQVGGSQLRFFRCDNEAMVYTVGNPGGFQVLAAGHVAGRGDEGRFIFEAERRSKLR
jgi:hypothetical protein